MPFIPVPDDDDVLMPTGAPPSTYSSFVSRWAFCNKVHIDDDCSIVAVVTGFYF